MNRPDSYINYFRNITAQILTSLDFYIMDINEVLEAMRSDIQYPALILINYNGLLQLGNADNPINKVTAGFMIITHLEVDDFNSEPSALKSTWDIGQQILARMQYEKAIGVEALMGFDLSSVKYEMMGPIFNNDIGFLYSWNCNVPLDTEFLPAFWGDYMEQ